MSEIYVVVAYDLFGCGGRALKAFSREEDAQRFIDEREPDGYSAPEPERIEFVGVPA